MKTGTKMARTALFMVAAVLASKLLGMLRDVLVAGAYGTTGEAVAYETASRLPILVFDLVIGGVVAASFIPVFNEILVREGKSAAFDYANRYINLLVVLTAGLSLGGVIFSSPLVELLAPALAEETHTLAVLLNRMMFPMMLFMALAYALVGLDEAQLQMFHRLRRDDAFQPPIAPFPHAEAVLRALSEGGARHYLYTHSKRHMSVRFLENFGLDRWFAGYVTPDDPGFAMKPDPGAIQYILAHWGIDPASAVMVGDREIDMRCAFDAGVEGILVDPDHLVGDTCARWRADDLLELLDQPCRRANA